MKIKSLVILLMIVSAFLLLNSNTAFADASFTYPNIFYYGDSDPGVDANYPDGTPTRTDRPAEVLLEISHEGGGNTLHAPQSFLELVYSADANDAKFSVYEACLGGAKDRGSDGCDVIDNLHTVFTVCSRPDFPGLTEALNKNIGTPSEVRCERFSTNGSSSTAQAPGFTFNSWSNEIDITNLINDSYEQDNYKRAFLKVEFSNVAVANWGLLNSFGLNVSSSSASNVALGFLGTPFVPSPFPLAMQDRNHTDKYASWFNAEYDNYDINIPFGAPCTGTIDDNIQLRWFDADAGPDGVPDDYGIGWELREIKPDGTLSGVIISEFNANNIGGQGEAGNRSLKGHIDLGKKYLWSWKNVRGINGIQFFVPHNAQNAFVPCDVAEYNHTVYHNIVSPTDGKVEPGGTVKVQATICNSDKGRFTANEDDKMVARIEAPFYKDTDPDGTNHSSFESPTKKATRVGVNDPGFNFNPDPNGGIYDQHARWSSSANNSSPLPLSDDGGACLGLDGDPDGRGPFTADFRIPADAKPGEKYCFKAAVGPATGEEGGAIDSVATHSATRDCFEVVLKPFFMIMGGDVNVGTVFESQVNAVDSSLQCSALPSSRYDEFLKTSEASIKGHIAFRNFEDDPSDSRPIGPSAEFAIYGLGNVRIPTFDTRKSLGVTKNIGGVFSNYYASNFLTGNTNVLEKGYFYSKDQSGGKDSLAYPPDCVPDYYEIEYDNPDKIKLTGGPDNYITEDNRLDISRLDSGVYYWDGSKSDSVNDASVTSRKPLEIFNTSPATEIDKEIIILSDQDVIIKDNIESKQPVFENGKIEFGAISIIVKGADIKVRYTNENQTVNNCCINERDRDTTTAIKFINHVDADLIALPTGNADYTYNSGGASDSDDPDGGNIFTCVGDDRGNYNPQFNILYGKCRFNLVITGKTIADKIWLLRTGNENQALHAVDRVGSNFSRRLKASEIMEMDPNRHFIYHLTGKKDYAGRLETTEDNLIPEIKSYKELPPIY